MQTNDLAMVSRIRVEVRGGSMEAAERVAFLVLDHAKMAGYLEGVVPESGEYTDHFFNRPNVTRKMEDGPEVWSELGLNYAGRLSFAFEPMVADGGLKQYGFEVTQVDDFTPHGLAGHDRSMEEPVRTDVTGKVMVLHRVCEVTRENTWDGKSGLAYRMISSGETTEEILDSLRDSESTHYVTVEPGSEGKGWRVGVIYSGPRKPSTYDAETLREAAVAALTEVVET